MLSKFLDEKSQAELNEILNKILFPVKCYCIIICLVLLLNAYYSHKILENLINLKK